MEIIPAILATTPEEFQETYKLLRAAGARRIHLDIADGKFVPNATISGYRELMELDDGVAWDIHLMVEDPERYVDHWWGVKGADRFFVHVEATDMFDELARHAVTHRAKVCPAINPNTGLDRLEKLCCTFDTALFMTVQPGFQGGAFLSDVLVRVGEFHTKHPDITLAVDGGVNPETAPSCAAAGATVLVSGSFVIKHADPARALQELRDSVIQ